MELNPYNIYWSDLSKDAQIEILNHLEEQQVKLPEKFYRDAQPITIVNLEELKG